ncbi:uncharacterized protein ATC70_012904 [Mucor velutinosus]|uniref:Uncharacterized protein n=1 Tax=Mucor velutinosus TaxID=708070 RepID=A0AAN7HS15_9FUNG|nr:hypothetical protein ATC70_012904 [Mucor velutinosus]
MNTTKLRDPKYKDADLAFLADKCHRLFLARLKVIIARLKGPHHQLAATRFFCFKQPVIHKDEYGQLAKTIKPAYKRQQSSATPAAAEQGHTLEEATNNTTNTAQPTPTLPELKRYQPPWSNK